MSGSAYARLVPKAHRAKNTPRIDRPMRPKMIAWAGPSAFYNNRFYEIDKWYKARIDKPQKIPKLHIIDPSKFNRTIEEVLEKKEVEKINIGFAKRVENVNVMKTTEERAVLEKKSRNQELLIDIDLAASGSLSIYDHYKVFDHLFGEGVYFEIVQHFEAAFGDNVVYTGNCIAAEDTTQRPQISLESVKAEGFNTIMMVNLDGNPFEKEGEVAQWIVKNIPDGGNVEQGEEVLSYLQPIPLKGTGYHRVAFVVFRHDKPLSLDFSCLSETLDGRIFSMPHFYKQNEEQITPSSLSFFQTTYDISCKEQLHKLGLKSPIFEYEYNDALKPAQKEFPHKPMPFDLYLDMYRDPKMVEKNLLEERLKKAQLDDFQPSKWLDINYNENKKKLPPWQHARMLERSGPFSALYENTIKE